MAACSCCSRPPRISARDFGGCARRAAARPPTAAPFNTPTPTFYSNGAPNTLATDASTRLARPWFTQQASYTYTDDYLYGGGDNEVNNDNARPLVTGSNGASLSLDWNPGALNLTSISAYKDYHFQAVNDEGTVFDVYRNSGGFWNDYKQWSQELRVSGTLGELADYQTGLYYLKVHNVADYRRGWGNDAGAWFATTAQYNRLDRAVNPDGSVSGGRALLQNSLDRAADVVQFAGRRAGHPEREHRGVRPGELAHRRRTSR